MDGELSQRPLTVQEAGRKGGKKVAEKYAGTNHFQEIGRKGGMATKHKHGSEHFQNIGSTGGKSRKSADATDVL